MRGYFNCHNHTEYSNLRLLDCINKPKALIVTFDIFERLLFATSGLLCVIPETKSDIIGIIVLLVLIVYQIIVKRVKFAKKKKK